MINEYTRKMIKDFVSDYVNANEVDSRKDDAPFLIEQQLRIIETHVHTLRVLLRDSERLDIHYYDNDAYLISVLEWLVRYDKMYGNKLSKGTTEDEEML